MKKLILMYSILVFGLAGGGINIVFNIREIFKMFS